jgi:ABC-type phosphate transport system substrate-binding protein
MMASKYPMVTAAVVVAIGSTSAFALPPLTGTNSASQPGAALVMAGSSAASPAVATGFENDVCGGSANTLIAASAGGSGNFLAFSCVSTVAVGSIPSGTTITVYYRTEGGSVVGALPLVSGKQIKRLDLTSSTCAQSGNTVTCSVTGTTSIDGLTDNWQGAVTEDTVQLGVTDVEPSQLTAADYPSNYASSAFGTATASQLAGLSTVRLFDQIFGLVVNTSGESFSKVNLTRESAANILNGNYTDWSLVPDALTGAPIGTAPAPITRVDREPGSGTRTSANIEFFGFQCSSANSIPNPAGETVNFSTTDELNAANGKAGSIAYASIDNILKPSNAAKFPNLVLATLNGIAPSTLAAATGEYDYWFEATLVPGSGVSGNSLQVSQFLQGDLGKLAKAPASPDILVIANVDTNVATVPLTSNGLTGTSEIFVNPFSRGGHSCNVPASQN